MFDFLNNFYPYDFNTIKKQVQKINHLEYEISLLTQDEIKARIKQLITKYKIEKKFDSILCETFALTREASKRTLGLRHYDVQIMGGIILHSGKIAEMKTGEGKTLVATLPVVLNALALKGVHIITVNDYLAKRDKQLMGQIYGYLGLSVGLIQEKMGSSERRKNYAANITYVTNSQVGFDYLRDNMCTSRNDLVLQQLHYAIIDEVDSILIDEARTPLIITNSVETFVEKYVIADEVCSFLEPKIDYIVDEKLSKITLTRKGIEHVEKLLDVSNLYDTNEPWIPYISNALKSKTLYFNNINYIVKNNEIIIIDEFTGRLMPDRRWGDGLHEAIEAKENVQIKNKSETLGFVTYQNLFLLYDKIAGMTGTAKTDEVEFEKIYKQKVISLPTIKKMIRNDLTDFVYIDAFQKWQAVIKEINKLRYSGQPILIGTTSIEKSEIISELLKNQKIKHYLLNAKPENIKFESEIIAQAGKKYAITVSTNIAGRGTDILLGGNPNFQTQFNIFSFIKQFKKNKINLLNNFINTKKIIQITKLKLNKNLQKLYLLVQELNNFLLLNTVLLQYKNIKLNSKELKITLNKLKYYTQTQIEMIIINTKENGYINLKNSTDLYLNIIYNTFYKKNKNKSNAEKEIVRRLGGLYVIGTDHHESRRIDNQLRGRSGRQGDPGQSRFFVSLDDDLFRIFGGEQLKKQMYKVQLANNIPLESTLLTKAVETVQKKVEDFYYDTRKELFDYDKILNSQRIYMYNERKALLVYPSVRSEMIIYGETLLSNLGLELKNYKKKNNRINFNKLNQEISFLLGLPYLFIDSIETNSSIIKPLLLEFWKTYDLKESLFENRTPGLIRIIEKTILLNQIDKIWINHLQKVTLLRETIGWRGYGKRDPLYEYKIESFNIFIETILEIKYNSIYNILRTFLIM